LVECGVGVVGVAVGGASFQ